MIESPKSDDVFLDQAINPIRREFNILLLAAGTAGVLNLNIRDAGVCPISAFQNIANAAGSECQRTDGALTIMAIGSALSMLISYRAWRWRGLAISGLVASLLLLCAAWISYEPNGRFRRAEFLQNEQFGGVLLSNFAAIALPVSFLATIIAVTAWFSAKRD